MADNYCGMSLNLVGRSREGAIARQVTPSVSVGEIEQSRESAVNAKFRRPFAVWCC